MRSIVVGIVFCVSAVSAVIAFPPALDSSAVGRASMDNRRIIDLINAYRSQNGLTVLRESPQLGRSTIFKINDMVRQSYFAHTDPEGRRFYDNVRKARYNFRSVAEVLAKGCRDEAQVVGLWTKSPSHKGALLNPTFLEINCSNSCFHGLTYVACHLARPKALATRVAP